MNMAVASFAFAAFLDAGAQEQRAQVLLDRTRADVETATSLLLQPGTSSRKTCWSPGGDLDLVEANHRLLSAPLWLGL